MKGLLKQLAGELVQQRELNTKIVRMLVHLRDMALG
jgi:hypothetical protein